MAAPEHALAILAARSAQACLPSPCRQGRGPAGGRLGAVQGAGGAGCGELTSPVILCVCFAATKQVLKAQEELVAVSLSLGIRWRVELWCAGTGQPCKAGEELVAVG